MSDLKFYLIPLLELYVKFHGLKNIALFIGIFSNNLVDNAIVLLRRDMEYFVVINEW